MALYRNPKIEAEMMEEEEVLKEEEIQKEEPTTPEEETWKNRYGDLRRHSQERDAQHKAQIEQLQRQIDGIKMGSTKPPKSETEINEWIQEYPDFADILDAIVDRKVQDKTKDYKAQSEELKFTKAKQALEEAVTGGSASEILAGNEFHEWLATQSDKNKAAIYTNLDVDDAAFVIEKYLLTLSKKSKPTGQDKNEEKEAAKSVKTKSAPKVSEDAGDFLFSESQINNSSSEWWDANEEKVIKAQREGRILMDITGGAR